MLPGLMRSLAAPRRAASMREPVVEVDVGHDRERRARRDALEARQRVGVRDRDAHDLASRLGEARDLGEGGYGVARVGGGHRLHGDGRAAADRHRADHDGTGLATRRGHARIHPREKSGTLGR